MHATLNGEELPIRLTAIAPNRSAFFMEVEPRADGVLRFEYRLSTRKWVGLVTTWVALLGLAIWLGVWGRPRAATA